MRKKISSIPESKVWVRTFYFTVHHRHERHTTDHKNKANELLFYAGSAGSLTHSLTLSLCVLLVAFSSLLFFSLSLSLSGFLFFLLLLKKRKKRAQEKKEDDDVCYYNMKLLGFQVVLLIATIFVELKAVDHESA